MSDANGQADALDSSKESGQTWAFRCGWCGMPTDEDGNPMGDDAPKTDGETVRVNGGCCPEGDGLSRLGMALNDIGATL